MHDYRYKHGDRPLEGYTIQRAIGRGGFGEVYYGVSDSGREVAIKAIQGYEQIELRGITQCMNLKSPHLVSIFDIKRNEHGKFFVVMEYVSGPSLRDLLMDAPSGLGLQKAGFFLREIGKGLSFLHESGIVHRDLKPGNIFYENGYVKVGDYGLSKAMSASVHSGQTITVGTVHYMAPEIGAGRYDRSIDIYALGVLLYEMLTGAVPFSGSSHGEILMKHMSAEPDLTGIDESMGRVIRKALAKDPSQRYQTVQEMVEDVFGSEQIRNSVSHFSPDSLTLVAGRVAREMGASPKASPPPPPFGLSPPPPPPPPIREPKLAAPPPRARAQTGEEPAAGSVDPISWRQRYMLAVVGAVAVAIGTSLFTHSPFQDAAQAALFVLLVMCGASAGLLLARDRINLRSETGAFRRLGFGAIACAASLVAASGLLMASSSRVRGTMLLVLVPLLLVDWYERMSPGRKERLSLRAAFLAGLCAFVCSIGTMAIMDMRGGGGLAVGILAGISLVVQVASPFRSASAKAPQPAKAPPEPPPLSPALPRVSRRKRLWALLLAMVFAFTGVGGLHRFYVGKIGTGIIWVLTFGLFGIGQLIDIIMICTGDFRDSHGRRLLVWREYSEIPGLPPTGPPEPPPAAAQDRTPSGALTRSFVGFRPVSALLSFVGTLLLLAGLLVALAVVVDLPGLTAAGVFGDDVAREMKRELGMRNWAKLARDLGTIVGTILGVLGVMLLILARRKSGLLHIFRAILGSCGLLLVVLGVGAVFKPVPWKRVAEHVNADRIGRGIELTMNALDRMWPLLLAGLLISVIVLAWPERRRLLPAAPPSGGS